MKDKLTQGSLFPEPKPLLMFSNEEMEKIVKEKMPEEVKMFYIREGFLDVENYYFRKDWGRIKFKFLTYGILP